MQASGPNRLSLQLAKPVNGASAKVTRYSNGKVDLEVASSQAGLLVLMDNNYPGWVARVDAETRPIQAMHPASRAVAIPAGKHQVTFSYEPPGFRRGLVISAAALLLVLTLLGMCVIAQIKQAKLGTGSGS